MIKNALDRNIPTFASKQLLDHKVALRPHSQLEDHHRNLILYEFSYIEEVYRIINNLPGIRTLLSSSINLERIFIMSIKGSEAAPPSTPE
jgi:hypothetical protein